MSEKAVYTLGCGDRFGREGQAQLAAYIEAQKQGIDVSPVWNKSNREHKTVHTDPASLRVEADAAVAAFGWSGTYFVDADHISLANVNALRHEQACADYNASFRQLIHVAYKVAYELGDEYFRALEKHSGIVGRNVTHNLLNRHILPIFG